MNQSERPNILWLSLEDTSPRFGCYGDEVARTPNIDRLADQGCRYPNAFSTAGVCAPSRAAIITGMYQSAIGAQHMRTAHTNEHAPEMPTPYEAVPPAYVKCFPEYLRRAGYCCTNNTKTDYQFAPPLTAWDQLSESAHWRNRPEGTPFFAVFNRTVTHESGMWPEKRPQVETDPDSVTLPPYLPDTPKARLALARHYDNLADNDRWVGQMLGQLEEDGLADNTIVFIWSDHGEGLPRAKRWPYDAGIRVPCIVRWPGQLEAGGVDERLVSMVDLGPTVLSLAGVDIPGHMQGQPFVGPAARERDYVFALRDRYDESYDMMRAVRDERYKYIRNFMPENPYLLWIPYRNRHPILEEMWRLHLEDALEGPQQVMFQPRPVEELYDTEADPFELDNLAADPQQAETLERLRGALATWRLEADTWGDVPEDQMVFSMWQGKQQPQTGVPVFIPISAENPGQEAAPQGGALAGPAMIQLYCGTQGASMAYQLPGDTSWRLYCDPIRLPQGETTLRARAIRIGYKESEQVEATFVVGH
ncbi:MAG: sulfatase-like hydrolase/transferase [Candidatus Latescibacteria bacterium]|nr:sulfatase-like hydrolase/transferase [Candidatus Latescibacterota bacterium]